MKILIVEDDYIVRQGIIYSLDWDKYDLCICGEAINGEQGLKLAEEQKPDIIITDIRMPIMDGITFSEKIKERFPDTEIIILSGYDDFTYAKQAIHIGVHEYLLKPIDADEFLKCVCRLRDEIYEKKRLQKRQDDRETLLSENQINIHDHLLAQAILPTFKKRKEQIMSNLNALGVVFMAPVFRVLLLTIEDFLFLTQNHTEEEKNDILGKIRKAICETFSSDYSIAECFLNQHFQYVIILNYRQISKLHIEDCCKKITEGILENIGFWCIFSCGTEKTDMTDIYLSYQEAVSALRYHICQKEQGVLYFEADMVKKEGVFLEVRDEENMLVESLHRYDSETVLQCVNTVFQKAVTEKEDFEKIKATCSRLVIMIISQLEEMSVSTDGTVFSSIELMYKIQQSHSLENLKRSMLSFMQKVTDVLKNTENEKYNVLVRSALQYVEKNYREEISVKTISSALYITPNYFSQIFKSQMGINFTDYLNEFRIGKAKGLLKNLEYKIYEVAEKTGYQNYKYFNKVFKKYTGYTPKEYRNLHEQK